MRFAVAVIALLLLSGISALGQAADHAHGSYSRNGILIGLTNLAPLRDCPVQSMEGKVNSVNVGDGTVAFELKAKDNRLTFQFPLGRLAEAEQKALRRNFLIKGVPLRATGFSCSESQNTLETISIDRLY